uniref:C-X-C motif chemokine 16-like n=1 Tax=Podarcis muralis TaxID=64176 RepID=UPI00109F49F4|nr:C-X-C motif chemokine 16-like [Podarcis muralis]
MGWRLPVWLALLLAGPALGNEGAAAGTCGSCQKHSEKQGKLSKYPQRMKNWETCMDLVKFTFPQGDCYLGLKSSDWVQALMKEFPEKEKGAVMLSPSHAPAKPALTSAPKPSTSQAPLSAQPPTVSLRVLDETSMRVLNETPAMHPSPEVPKDATQPPTSTGSPAPLGHDPLAAGPASQAPQTAERGVSPTVVLPLLAVTLVAVAIATTVVCQRRHRQRRETHVPLGDPEEQIHLPHHREKT